jgi:hypothetical protein
MNWFTCIIFNPAHVTPVQYFHTRAKSKEKAESNALKWICDGDPDMQIQMKRDLVEVVFVFYGRLFPE